MNHEVDIDAFLRKPLIAHLATASEFGPRDSPLWFLWEDGALWFVGNGRDGFPKRVHREPRCAVGIVDFDLPHGLLTHVGMRGTGTVEQVDRHRLHRLLGRYLGPDLDLWNEPFRRTVIDKLDLMVRVQPTSVVARDQSYFSNASPRERGLRDRRD